LVSEFTFRRARSFLPSFFPLPNPPWLPRRTVACGGRTFFHHGVSSYFFQTSSGISRQARADLDIRLRGHGTSLGLHTSPRLTPLESSHTTRLTLFTASQGRSAELTAGHSNGTPAPTSHPVAVTQCVARLPESLRKYICHCNLRFVLFISQISSVISKSG
jgi:hypothetical protein